MTSGAAWITFYKRLGDEWRDLATALEIPPHVQARFTRGDEARGIHDYLNRTQRLSSLPDALHEVDRSDLIATVELAISTGRPETRGLTVGNQAKPDHLVAFISYAPADGKPFTLRLRDWLRRIASDLTPWPDAEQEPGESFWTAVEPALRGVNVVLFVMTRASVVPTDTNWCDSTLHFAHQHNIPAIFLRVHPDAELPPSLLTSPPIDFTDESRYDWSELPRQLRDIGAPIRTYQEIEENLSQTEAEGKHAEGDRQRRLRALSDYQRARREEERQRLGTDVASDQQPTVQIGDPSAGYETQPRIVLVPGTRMIRLINPMPELPPVGFGDRIKEMHDLEAMLRDPAVRLIALCGPEGVGKTAMLAELRRRLADGRTDVPADAFIYLFAHGNRRIGVRALLSDLCWALPADQAVELLPTLDAPMPWRDKLADVLAALSGQAVIAVIDDAEELFDDQGSSLDRDLEEILGDLARTNAGVRVVLLTQRKPATFLRPLRRHARILPLDEGLPREDAIALLGSLDDESLGLATGDPADLQKLHALTLGRPRSLELVAGVLRGLPSGSIDYLIGRLDEVSDVPRTLLEMVLEQLDRTERRVVQALAVFGRPVPSAAVDNLLRPYLPRLVSAGILHRLSDRQLVRRDEERYYLPPAPDAELVRSTIPAATGIDDGVDPPPFTLSSLSRAAAAHFRTQRRPTVTSADDLRPQFSEIELLMRAGDLPAALRLMNDLDDRYLISWGQSDALTPWRDKKLRGKLGKPELEGLNLSYLVEARLQQDDIDGAIPDLTIALDYAKTIGDEQNAAVITLQLAGAYLDDRRLPEAAKHYRQAIEECRRLGTTVDEAGGRMSLGLCLAMAGKFREAGEQFAAGLALADALPSVERRPILAQLLLNAGWWHGQRGDSEKALTMTRKAGQLAESLNDDRLVGWCLNGEAAILLDSGDARSAILRARKAADIAVEKRNAALSRRANVTLALALLCVGDDDAAVVAADAGARYFRTPQALDALGMQGLTALRTGDYDKARDAFAAACVKGHDRLDRDRSDYLLLDAYGLALFGLAVAGGEQENLQNSCSAYRKARTIASEQGLLRRVRLLLDQFRECADRETLDVVRSAACGSGLIEFPDVVQ